MARVKKRNATSGRGAGSSAGTGKAIKLLGRKEIGSWGKELVFKVSSGNVLTFKGYERSISSRWSEHGSLFGKPAREFQGAGLETIRITVELFSFLGADIPAILERLEEAVYSGTVNYLVIGGKRQGKNKFTLDEISESFDVISGSGKILQAGLTLTFKEYV